MRVSTLLAASAVLAPATTLAIALPWDLSASPMEIAASALHSAQGWLYGVTVHGADAIKDKLAEYEQTISSGVRTATVDMHGIEYLAVSHPAFPQHKLRVVEPKICDPKVKQLSGYLDISDSKHLFFWFEASRSNPSKDPLVLWLNGGPGCSSSTGLLFELGGCTVIDGGNNVTYNKDAWNNNANVIFLDQPVGVGYSYSDNGNEVNNSPASAEDVYAFLMLFISQFSEYSKQDFHVAGESYAGTYIPNIASVIYKHNAALEVAPTPKMPKINLKSVLIGNGLTDPFHQFGSLPAAACDGPYAVFDPEGSECVAMRGKVPRCQNLISSCYKTGSRFACLPASLYCWSMFSPLQQLGVNLYDVRKTCDKSKDKDGPLCYKEMGWMETYLNRPEVKKELGAPAEATFQSCNMQINQNFLMQGDGTHNTVGLLPELVESGIRVLIYAGMADMMVNYIGCAEVLDNLETSYLGKYTAAPIQNFTAPSGEVVGWTKSAGKGAGNVAFVAFNNAGHMVPHDEPKASLKMLNDWLKNKPLA